MRVKEIMYEGSIGSVLIEENGRVIGIMNGRDILRKIVAKGKNPDKVKAKEITANSISRSLKYMLVREPQVYTKVDY